MTSDPKIDGLTIDEWRNRAIKAEEDAHDDRIEALSIASQLKDQLREIVNERNELRHILAKGFATSIRVRAQAYESGLRDAGYKLCDKCGETCIPTCVACEERDRMLADEALGDDQSQETAAPTAMHALSALLSVDGED